MTNKLAVSVIWIPLRELIVLILTVKRQYYKQARIHRENQMRKKLKRL